MSSHASLSASELPASEQQLYDERAATLRHRRAQAARVRRRRLVVLDVGIGAALAIFGLIAAPGLAILGLAAFLALGACAAWVLAERIRARRHSSAPPNANANAIAQRRVARQGGGRR